MNEKIDRITSTIERANASAGPWGVMIEWTIRHDLPDGESQRHHFRASRAGTSWTLRMLSAHGRNGDVLLLVEPDLALMDRIRRLPGTYDLSGAPIIHTWLAAFYRHDRLVFDHEADRAQRPQAEEWEVFEERYPHDTVTYFCDEKTAKDIAQLTTDADREWGCRQYIARKAGA